MTIYLVELEPVETRYTAQWQVHLPTQLRDKGLDVVVIEGPQDTPQDTTPGAFLNFSGTNYWKSEQLKTISQLFADGKVNDGDYFLYTDAWNPTVIQLKYMASLLEVDIKIGGMWHAGSYDPQDFLGRLIGDAKWVRDAEKSMYEIYDHNFFATDFHIQLFAKELLGWKGNVQTGYDNKIVRTGWPMEYLKDEFEKYKGVEKEDIILFPHRLAPEKQLDIFLDLKETFPEYEFIVCQDQGLTKDEYHQLLAKSKIVFSANLQETLGISWYEGLLLGCIPMIPDRLSYKEMGHKCFKYKSEWTESFDKYKENKLHLTAKISKYMKNYNDWRFAIAKQTNKLEDNFFSGSELYRILKEQQK